MQHFFWINALIFLLNHGGSLSSHTTNLCRMTLLRIFRIVLLKMSTFSLTMVFKKAQSQLNSLIARLMSLVVASLYCETSRA